MTRFITTLLVASPFIIFNGCTAIESSNIRNSDDKPAEGGSTADGGGGMGGVDLNATGGNNSGGGPVNCMPSDNEDWDQDGWSITAGDCNDCDANVGPNAIEVVNVDGEAVDEDCDDVIDEEDVYVTCDSGLALDTSDPLEAVKAVDLCKVSSGIDDWGVVSASWVMADGNPPPTGYEAAFHLGHGILPTFGVAVSARQGENMLVLSSGSARTPDDPGYQDVGGYAKGYQSNHPVGFPKESPSCPGTITGQPNDSTGLKVSVRTPSNAHGLTFDFNFYTYEWPQYVCSTFNDFFVALLTPFPQGQNDGNIVFDNAGNPVSVNNAFLEVCGCPGNPPSPCSAGNKTFQCSLGNLELIGTGFGFDTGFEDHAATSWLSTQAPVEPNTEIELLWAVYDSGDGVLDSTAIIDNFRWIAKPGVPVSTNPVPK